MAGSALVLVHQQMRGADTPDEAKIVVDDVLSAHSAI